MCRVGRESQWTAAAMGRLERESWLTVAARREGMSEDTSSNHENMMIIFLGVKACSVL